MISEDVMLYIASSLIRKQIKKEHYSAFYPMPEALSNVFMAFMLIGN